MSRTNLFGRVAMLVAALLALACLGPVPASAADGPGSSASAGDHSGDHASGDHASGDHGGDHGKSSSPIAGYKEALASSITALVVFGIALFILSTKVWPMITAGLDERNAKIREEIASAEAARAQARAALEEYQQSLSHARVEAQRMLDETRTEQARLAADLKARAERDLNEMREKAKRDIDNAKKAALGEIYTESVSLATRMAGKILQREVTAGDQQRMLEESLAELAGSRSN